MNADTRNLRLRFLIAGFLAVVLVVLLVQGRAGKDQSQNPKGISTVQSMDMLVDSVLARHGVDLAGVKKWRVRTPGGETIRIERHVVVPSDLVTLEFNRDLNQEVARSHALVSATERSKESTVILHVVAEGTTIQTIHMETARDVSGGKTANRQSSP